MQQRIVQGRVRPTEGHPPWLPPGARAELRASEKQAYRGGEEGRVLVETGLFETGTGFLFVCPVCGNKARNDQRLEPLCTGPSWTNDHPGEIMVLIEQ